MKKIEVKNKKEKSKYANIAIQPEGIEMISKEKVKIVLKLEQDEFYFWSLKQYLTKPTDESFQVLVNLNGTYTLANVDEDEAPVEITGQELHDLYGVDNNE